MIEESKRPTHFFAARQPPGKTAESAGPAKLDGEGRRGSLVQARIVYC